MLPEYVNSVLIVYKAFHDSLNIHISNLLIHSSRLVLIQLSSSIYIDDDYKHASDSIAKAIISSGRLFNPRTIPATKVHNRPPPGDIGH